MSRLPAWCRSTDISASSTITFDGLRVLPFSEVSVVVAADQDGKVTFEQGVDAQTYQFTEYRHVYADKPADLKFNVATEYGRLKYENLAASDTSGFKMGTYGFHDDTAQRTDANILVAGSAGAPVNLAAAASTQTANVTHLRTLDIFGTANPDTTLDIYYSHNDSNYYKSIWSVTTSGDFHMNLDSGAKYLQIKNAGVDTSLFCVVAGK